MFLFNDALNTFYLQLYGDGHLVKDHSDSETENLLLLTHGLFFLISSKGSFIFIHPTDRTAHTTSTYHNICYINCGALEEQEIAYGSSMRD